jgi:hypothetical protein
LECWLSLWCPLRAPQPHADEDGKDVRITVRQIVEGCED